jgi:hypothetical protein
MGDVVEIGDGEYVRFYYGPGRDYFEVYIHDDGLLDVRAPHAALAIQLTGGVNHIQVEAVRRT